MFRISFQPDQQIDYGIFNRPIKACTTLYTQILLHSWWPRTRILVLGFTDGLNQKFSSICSTGYAHSSLPRSRFLDVMQRSHVTSKKRLRGRLYSQQIGEISNPQLLETTLSANPMALLDTQAQLSHHQQHNQQIIKFPCGDPLATGKKCFHLKSSITIQRVNVPAGKVPYLLLSLVLLPHVKELLMQ